MDYEKRDEIINEIFEEGIKYQVILVDLLKILLEDDSCPEELIDDLLFLKLGVSKGIQGVKSNKIIRKSNFPVGKNV